MNIRKEIQEIAESIISTRRDVHKHPELGFQEFRTAKLIATRLRELGIEIQTKVGKTGVVATIQGIESGQTIALRADMDALPIQENSDINYKSVNDGVMHACGHDGHIAMLLGVAEVLKTKSIRGTVKLIFQPAEEGEGGAKFMIEDGCLDGVDEIYGVHLWNYQKFGTIGIKSGPVMAAADGFKIDIKGIGGHGATPQGTVDAIVVTSHLITALQTIVSRNTDPLENTVITVGKIEGGSNFNVISDSVHLEGTARAYTEENRIMIKQRMKEIIDGTAKAFGAEILFEYKDGYPPTINHPEPTETMRSASEKIVGENVGKPFLSMGGEDFSYYAQKIPASYGFIGSTPKHLKPEDIQHHSSHFNFEEDAMLIGASLLLQIIDDKMVIK
ncbi:MAG: amidohydrolase [Candidatus Marinimicrobia bacterium]|nr:amidohydrolase [Candidatus Neomarinimicrobiota bacterium]MBL7022944.1 amidohydrolase [Candidatus Neomarinimicrobiota bacterium]MBL7108762.1 amidohydrolase [Candidatus Neomarinimicrobiota bacterium]